jgi:uracil phosphoribosyltransferase
LPVSLHVIGHPVAHDALRELRDHTTASSAFRRAATRISLVLAAEALAALPTRPATVTTPLGPADGRALAADVVVVPVLRAGLSMVEAVLQLVPDARVGHVGLQRDEVTAAASQYYARLPPDLERSHVFLVDPMLATGGSASAAIDVLKAAGARSIALICIVCAPEGIAEIESRHADVPIYTPVVDAGLNASKFILPGLGDFGDRLFGT